ncbi:UDP-N-acetylmuramoyl-L-alanine--D-glutamate ligase [Gammaproteobacteria bacterium AB-CW1]|uniref:UDP-N-acetylmuramoylalanine--D-glutamate ligase n=1 Tax=Natronospira elongata TaxID=3110268 RepID=A0AAP6JD89_9GAMM|nr:UDP-N-acetylmuramoyl-L-alanine--D-glutamate ligase [Gammaproteobacteria bacterium AB-CW1]
MAAIADKQPRQNLVIGLGRTGLSLVRHLLARGESVAVVDSRVRPPMLERLNREYPAADWQGAIPDQPPTGCERILLSPGVAADLPLLQQARAQGLEVIGDVELFARHHQAPLVAVTGSNGKSTVVSLIAHLAGGEAAGVFAGGNLGQPALDLLASEPKLCVLELSSFQLESTSSLDARVGVVLNVSEDHLDRHGDMDQYTAAKARLVGQSRTLVLNRDDPRVAAMAGDASSVVWFGAGQPRGETEYGLLEADDGLWLVRGERRLVAADRLPLAGRHNQLNLLAALATLELLGYAMDEVLARLETFSGLPHRMQTVPSRDGRRWINDSKATNLGATLAALAGLDAPVVLIAGGQPKGQDFAPLGPALARSARGLVVIGEAADQLSAVAPTDLPLRRAADMPAAVSAAAEMAHEGDVILLSPACASFDQFRDFAARGQAFEQAVQAREVRA